MNNRIDAIYARQSVDKKGSISIESQIEFCKYELKGGNCKEYTDKGYSGKNTERPKFQQLVTLKAGPNCGKWWFTSSTASAVPFSTLRR